MSTEGTTPLLKPPQSTTIPWGGPPWPAVDPLVGLLEPTKSRTRGSGADGGARPTFGCGYAALWDRRFRLSTRERGEHLAHV
jgi:hypothetical protein